MFNKRISILVGFALLAGAIFYGPGLTHRLYRHFYRPVYQTPVARAEITLTIIPGWNLRQVAEYLVLKGLATSTEDVLTLTGEPAAKNKPKLTLPISSDIPLVWDIKPKEVSWEGYLAPESIRVYADAPLPEVLKKFALERNHELKPFNELLANRTWHEILTMASIIEKETRHDEDRAKVADILWRRLKKGWALEVDSSVHYALDKTGDVFTTDRERTLDSPWNTYKYPGLPPGPICNPGLDSIKAALTPKKNDDWYFLSGKDGKMYYGKTLEEHNLNKKHL